MHVSCSYGSAGVLSIGNVGACLGGHIARQGFLIFMKININRVHSDSYWMHLAGLISSEWKNFACSCSQINLECLYKSYVEGQEHRAHYNIQQQRQQSLSPKILRLTMNPQQLN